MISGAILTQLYSWETASTSMYVKDINRNKDKKFNKNEVLFSVLNN